MSEPGECRSASESLKVVICVLRKQRLLVSLPFKTNPKHLLYADSLLLARRSAGLGVGMDTPAAIACFVKRQRQSLLMQIGFEYQPFSELKGTDSH